MFSVNNYPKESIPFANSKVKSLISGACFHDAWAIQSAYPDEDALDQFLRVVSQTPRWIDALMVVRNLTVSMFGLKNLGALSQVSSIKTTADYVLGDRVGIFTLLYKSEDEMLLCDQDKHLSVVVSVHKQTTQDDVPGLVTVTTVVLTHNWLGRLYMIPVRPLHRIIARSMTSAVGCT